ncbi:ECF transporter S component, folate family [Carnobacterium iners]|uniref:ECF transporter S component, folate family n=1 Tax=Carnobacterium iners TaxID=1073423 RepID=A0A1X7MRA5_9LACT|nr:folate family ECF transporter S component [Carnobacterium iners]SEL00092.1 ECF transporter S component, folate family [Carnobacterium iners]SMH27154.1 ECF transporter S component, folate family [Carnobacterium iners]
MVKNKFDARSISIIGLLMGLDIILTRFIAIETPIVRIGFSFLPVAIIAMLYGPWIAGTAAAMADFMGIMLFPKIALYFPGFTLSAFLGGVIYGLILYKKPKTLKRVILAVLLTTVIVNLGLNTLWLKIILDKAIYVIFPARVIQNLVLAPVNCILLYGVLQNKAFRKAIKLK